MMPAEQWYEYRKKYSDYGLSMEPERKKEKKRVKKSGAGSKDFVMFAFFAMVIGVLGIGVIISNAYEANIQCSINEVMKENGAIMGEIENLRVDLNQANNIQAIESRAAAELGMIYPNPNDFIYVEADVQPVRDFAVLLQEEAYSR